MNKIIITADLGHFIVYKVTKEPMESARTTLICSYDSLDAHGKLGDKLSDEAGRFGVGGGKNGAAKGYGESHNIKNESRKKLIKLMAQDINRIIIREDCQKWYLAVPKRINRQVIDNLAPDVRSRLAKNITADLTKMAKSRILGKFE
ncbi:MAG TPA: hypothetical protein ENH40_04855 [Nitrospirae bacterium]|nr:hypothetical protein [Nitrospirota bacterium]